MGLGAILIRADASPAIGTGHVMRCLALAQAWQDSGGDAVFACAEFTPGIEQRLGSENIALRRLVAPAGSLEDAAETAAIARELEAEWVVIDGFHFATEYLLRPRRSGTGVLLLDDHSDRRSYAGEMILNPNIFASPDMYEGRGCREVLAGPQFALLRREFRTLSTRKTPANTPANRMLITMGGSDPENVTSRVMTALNRVCANGLNVTIISGAASRHGSALESATASCTYPVRLLANVTHMPEIMRSVDMAISAPGGTCSELACLGVPMLLVTIAENHARTGEEFERQRLAFSTGWYDRLSTQDLARRIQQFLDDAEGRSARAMAAAARIDGRGAERVVAAMLTREVAAQI